MTVQSKPNNILQKHSIKDPELLLSEALSEKHGKRFFDYRRNYQLHIKDVEHKLSFNYPITVVLELVNRCDLECIMCYQGYRNESAKSTIDNKILDKIFEDFKRNKLQALMLTASEPLLYKHIDKVLKKAVEAEIIDIFLFTNGSLLNEKNSRMILESGVTRLFISIDAATEETYNKIRVPVGKKIIKQNRLQILEEKIKNFINLKKSMKKVMPVTRVSFVALKENFHEIELFKKKWESIVDTVEIQRETSINIYQDLKNEFNEFNNLKNYNCNKPWGDLAIYSNGSVGPCCNLVGRKISIGNIIDSTVSEIWNGIEMKKIRKSFINNKPNRICRACIESQKINL